MVLTTFRRLVALVTSELSRALIDIISFDDLSNINIIQGISYVNIVDIVLYPKTIGVGLV